MQVCECFEFGFPPQWLKLLYPNMEQQNEQSESESTANAPRHSVEYYMENFFYETLHGELGKPPLLIQ